jgi:hypothetical protein
MSKRGGNASYPPEGEIRFFILEHEPILNRRMGQENGGAYRDRTDDLKLAKQPLSQLS